MEVEYQATAMRLRGLVRLEGRRPAKVTPFAGRKRSAHPQNRRRRILPIEPQANLVRLKGASGWRRPAKVTPFAGRKRSAHPQNRRRRILPIGKGS
jgi:hypothetical protein